MDKLQTMPLRFRVWDKEAKGFVKSISDENDPYISQNIEMEIGGVGLLTNYYGDSNFIISQYTGLKDKNGNDIYTGDIVELPGWTDRGHEVVKYSLPCRGIIPCVKGCPQCCNPQPVELEVIGNIWENPELLEEKNE